MRLKNTLQGYFKFSGKSSLKVVKEYRRKYESIDRLLGRNPRIINLAHKDLSGKLSVSVGGRESRYSSSEILRALIVMFVEGDSYRDVVIRIENSEFLRDFVGLGVKPMMDYSFLSRAFGILSEETWQSINQALCSRALAEGKIDGKKMRLDSTVYEANIHYPTDSSLLWDSYRTLARLLRRIGKELPELGLRHRYHDKKIKRLANFISRNGSSRSRGTQRQVKRAYRKLIERVTGIAYISREILEVIGGLSLKTEELERYTPIVERIIGQARRRVLEGEQVPATEKVYSLFEEHTELLKRGKAGKPIEFGHKALIVQTGQKFISHYQALPVRCEDKDLLTGAVRTHQKCFKRKTQVLAADKGFYESREQLAKLRRDIRTVSIGKKGRRTREEENRESTKAFKAGQCFRAGSEGSISVLKRAFKLNRCLFKGFKNYAASLGCAVFCHNLVLLTRL